MTELNSERSIAITRLVCAFITIANFTLTAFGWNPLPFAESDVYTIVSCVGAVVATLWAWWWNNNITRNAVQAQEYLDDLRIADKSEHGVA